MAYSEIIKYLKSLSNPKDRAGMARFGIDPRYVLGIRIPVLRNLARQTGKDHALAAGLWSSRIHEARILAGMVEDPGRLTERQMESWVREFNSWDLCDQVCSNLFDKHPAAWRKAIAWSRRREEYIKRAGFVIMATLSVHDKRAPDSKFYPFFKRISAEAADERNFVKKAVNWALRQIGKRNLKLNRMAVITAQRIAKMDSSAARWVAADALRELTSKEVRGRLKTQDQQSPLKDSLLLPGDPSPS